jgi:hypothetical protein
MKREHIGRHFAVAFLLALLLYGVTYWFIEHLRTRKGGWQVTFCADSNGVPSVNVAQPALGISNVRFTFPSERIGQSNVTNVIMFDQPHTNVPFGHVVYFDTTFLPGVLVFGLFGHEIQLMPRVLTIDRQEIPWKLGLELQLGKKSASP